MDDLIKTVSEKAGINAEQAKAAVGGMIEFLKAKAPMIADQLKGVLEGGGGGPLAGLKDKLGGMLGGKS